MRSKDILNYLDVKTNKVKILFFDLDGTLLDSNKQISEKCIKYLYHLKNNYNFRLGIASGRHIPSILNILNQYGIYNLFNAIIANNGADIVLNDNNTTKKLGCITKNTVKELINVFCTWENVTVFFHDENKLYSTKIDNRILDIKYKNSEESILNPAIDFNYHNPSRISLMVEDIEIIEKIKNISFKNLKGYHSEPLIYEYVYPTVSKSNGIKYYIDLYDWDMQDVMVFGDGNNDVEMLEDCGFGICMKNGEGTAALVANEVTEYTNDEDGIVKFLEKYIKELSDEKFSL